MPQSDEGSDLTGVAGIDSSEAQQILISIRTLRWDIVKAWQASAVVLTEDERRALREEIMDTCDLLTGLTAE